MLDAATRGRIEAALNGGDMGAARCASPTRRWRRARAIRCCSTSSPGAPRRRSTSPPPALRSTRRWTLAPRRRDDRHRRRAALRKEGRVGAAWRCSTGPARSTRLSPCRGWSAASRSMSPARRTRPAPPTSAPRRSIRALPSLGGRGGDGGADGRSAAVAALAARALALDPATPSRRNALAASEIERDDAAGAVPRLRAAARRAD